MIPHSRHPKINYWFWKDTTFEDRKYLQTLERIASCSRFDTIALTDRGCDIWDPSHKEDFRALVTHAHELGLRIVLQLWPCGAADAGTVFLTTDEAGAIALDIETTVVDGKATLRSKDQWTRGGEVAAPIDSEFLCAYVFKKNGRRLLRGRYAH